MIPAAQWWRAVDEGLVACDLCPIGCRLPPGQTGLCGARGNRDGQLVPLTYGRLVSSAFDPIEKKPLYHFHPGSFILSVAGPGCNLHCSFCQNWNISQSSSSPTVETTPEQLVSAALAEEAVGIAYTYSEPLVWYEFVLDTARLARERGLKNVLVTNGFLNPGPLAELLPFIDAANVDLKAMDDDFYRQLCRARLAPVLAAIGQIHAAGVHLELTNLLIPGHNDHRRQIQRLVDFVGDLDRTIPLHFSAYRPAWRLEAPPTPLSTLLTAREIALGRLDWVYLGNVTASQGRDTLCPDCGASAIVRAGFQADLRLAADGSCLRCGRRLPLILA